MYNFFQKILFSFIPKYIDHGSLSDISSNVEKGKGVKDNLLMIRHNLTRNVFCSFRLVKNILVITWVH